MSRLGAVHSHNRSTSQSTLELSSLNLWYLSYSSSTISIRLSNFNSSYSKNSS